MPDLQFIAHDQLDMLTAKCADLDPIADSRHLSLRSHLAGRGRAMAHVSVLIAPVLVGPQDVIAALARENGLDISAFRLVDARHEKDAAAKGVALAKAG